MMKDILKSKRKDCKLSQEQFAELLFMSQSQYNRREKGLIKISTEEWKKMAKILNVEVENIFESDDDLRNIVCREKEESNSNNRIKIKIKIPLNEANELSKKLDKLINILENKF